jgi:hypothetical protein
VSTAQCGALLYALPQELPIEGDKLEEEGYLVRLALRISSSSTLVVLTKRRNEFTVQEIVLRLREDYPEFSERAIGEAIAVNSRQGAPARNGDSQVAFEKIGPTGYRLVTRFGLARQEL